MGKPFRDTQRKASSHLKVDSKPLPWPQERKKIIGHVEPKNHTPSKGRTEKKSSYPFGNKKK